MTLDFVSKMVDPYESWPRPVDGSADERGTEDSMSAADLIEDIAGGSKLWEPNRFDVLSEFAGRDEVIQPLSADSDISIPTNDKTASMLLEDGLAYG
jgi:hypothetical protein